MKSYAPRESNRQSPFGGSIQLSMYWSPVSLDALFNYIRSVAVIGVVACES